MDDQQDGTTEDVVLISYSHDSPEHAAKVKQLADTLRSDGVVAEIDQYLPVAGPPEGWARWMNTMIARSRFIIVVCSATYQRRFDGHEDEPGVGRGVSYEGQLLHHLLYNAKGQNYRLVPVLFDDEPETSIPSIMGAYKYFRLPAAYEDVYAVLTHQGGRSAPPVRAQRTVDRPAPAPLPSAWSGLGARTPSAEQIETIEKQGFMVGKPAGEPTRSIDLPALEALLLSMFSLPELQRLVRYLPMGEQLSRQLPTGAVAPAHYVTQLLQTLERQGALDNDFFDAIRQARPRRVGELDRLLR